ncbi:RING-H2 finger protein ATL2 [Quercus robur]|uniref:RING-H2 finger protein ATL2 n=1 Tax=Quercus robur TaxID=38942 RepID=UPI0021627231|nr:RING-H2 finger protein ATL2 [Quercus robur]
MGEPDPAINHYSGQSYNYGSGSGYELSGKIMLSAIVILLFVVVLMVCLHLYARWYLIRARRRQSRRVRRRTRIVFYVDPSNPNSGNAVTVSAAGTRGLDAFVLASLPVFVYSEKTHPELPECAVCLSEFEENETGRTLPKCKHSFHIGCIDMWFHSHSTCPLCRSAVEPDQENTDEVVISINEPDSGSSSELCSDCQHEDGHTGSGSGSGPGQTSSSGGSRLKDFAGVSIEIPRRNENFRDEFSDSPASQGGFRSPMSRMLSFTRILSRDRRSNMSSPTVGNVEVSCGGGTTGSVNESDVERETRQTQRDNSEMTR